MDFYKLAEREVGIWRTHYNVHNEYQASQYGIDNGEGNEKYPGLNQSYIRYCLLQTARPPKRTSKTQVRKALRTPTPFDNIKKGCLQLPKMELELPKTPQWSGWDVLQSITCQWVHPEQGLIPNVFVYLALWKINATFPGDLGCFFCVLDVNCLMDILAGQTLENAVGAIPKPNHLNTLLKLQSLLD